MAWNARSLPCLADPRGLEDALPPGGVPGLPRGLPSLVGLYRLLDDHLGHSGVLEHEFGQFLVHQGADRTLCDAASQFGLGLSLELGLGHLDAHDGGQSLADIRSLEGQVLEQVVLLTVIVGRLGEGRPESREVRSSLGGVDRVDERIDLLVVSVRPLHGDVDGHTVPLT